MEKLKNSKSQQFFDKSRELSISLTNKIMTFSVGIIGVFFLLLFNEKTTIPLMSKIALVCSIALFGIVVLISIQVIQYEVFRFHSLGEIFQQETSQKKTEFLEQKRKIEKKALRLKRGARILFLLGISLSALFLILFIFDV